MTESNQTQKLENARTKIVTKDCKNYLKRRKHSYGLLLTLWTGAGFDGKTKETSKSSRSSSINILSKIDKRGSWQFHLCWGCHLIFYVWRRSWVLGDPDWASTASGAVGWAHTAPIEAFTTRWSKSWSWCYPKFYTCWKIIFLTLLFTPAPVHVVLSFSSASSPHRCHNFNLQVTTIYVVKYFENFTNRSKKQLCCIESRQRQKIKPNI